MNTFRTAVPFWLSGSLLMGSFNVCLRCLWMVE